MKARLLSATTLAVASLTSLCATAADGTITFSGALTADTCTIGGAGGGDFTVTLPTLPAAKVTGNGTTGGPTVFSINLTACPATTSVHTYFEPDAAKINAAGRLINIGTAKNVDIELLNSDNTVIVAGQPTLTQNSKPVTTDAAGAATLNYMARYYATGQTDAGSVSSFVTYSIAYQ